MNDSNPDGPTEQHYEVFRSSDAKSLHECALVLSARRVPFVEVSAGADQILAVPQPFVERALHELGNYAKENVDWPPAREEVVTLSDGKYAALLYSLVITFVYLLQIEQRYQLPLLANGRADAGAILAGEWWRTITALTLHADLTHLVSNLFFGAFFIAFTCHLVGTGIGMLSVLLSGIFGTVLNAIVQDPSHLSVGASTCVFGSIGVYVAFLWADRRRRNFATIYVWAPILVGFALLATYGIPDVYSASGRLVDVVAHATGFGAGLLIGALLGRSGSRKLNQPSIQLASGLLAGLLIVAGWTAALL